MVLLVEHDIDTREMYAEYLRACGFTLRAAVTTDEGLSQAPHANVIITAIRVPGSFDGFELIERLRGQRSTKDTPIIVLTGCAFEPDRERARMAGCDVFLAKPCLPELLADTIRRVLALRRVAKPRSGRAARVTRRAHRAS